MSVLNLRLMFDRGGLVARKRHYDALAATRFQHFLGCMPPDPSSSSRRLTVYSRPLPSNKISLSPILFEERDGCTQASRFGRL